MAKKKPRPDPATPKIFTFKHREKIEVTGSDFEDPVTLALASDGVSWDPPSPPAKVNSDGTLITAHSKPTADLAGATSILLGNLTISITNASGGADAQVNNGVAFVDDGFAEAERVKLLEGMIYKKSGGHSPAKPESAKTGLPSFTLTGPICNYIYGPTGGKTRVVLIGTNFPANVDVTLTSTTSGITWTPSFNPGLTPDSPTQITVFAYPLNSSIMPPGVIKHGRRHKDVIGVNGNLTITVTNSANPGDTIIQKNTVSYDEA